MLGAPSGAFSVQHDLAFQNALDAFCDGLFRARAALGIDKCVAGFVIGDSLEQAEDGHHRLVIESDVEEVVFRVAVGNDTREVFLVLGEGGKLRPAPVFVLGIEEIIEALEESCFESFLLCGVEDTRQVFHLRVGRAVVDRAVRFAPGGFDGGAIRVGDICGQVDPFFESDGLWPAAGVALVKQHVVSDADSLGPYKPIGLLAHERAEVDFPVTGRFFASRLSGHTRSSRSFCGENARAENAKCQGEIEDGHFHFWV